MTTYPCVSSLIPHRPPMLLVSRVLDVQEKTGSAEAPIKADHLFLRKDGTLLPETCCELIAQGYGVCEAYRRTQKGLTIEGGGYLATLRDMEIFAPARAGDVLTVRTEKMDECFGTYIVRGEVFCNKQKLAQATVYIFMWQGEPPKSL
ncbi:MAG: hypothetical protein II913_03700 [Elusimicrobiaceae bacterium]|nr:hypothetical protein [Elusimicrobiaceae bacterium]